MKSDSTLGNFKYSFLFVVNTVELERKLSGISMVICRSLDVDNLATLNDKYVPTFNSLTDKQMDRCMTEPYSNTSADLRFTAEIRHLSQETNSKWENHDGSK